MVVPVAVEFDREAELGPPAIDPPPTGRAVGVWQHETGVAQMAQEARLESAERDTDIAAQDLAQLRRAWAGRSASKRPFDRDRRQAVADAGLVADARQLIDRHLAATSTTVRGS